MIFPKVAHLWNQGSVIRSWLLELLEDAFKKDPKLTGIKGYVEDSGEGRWTVQQAIESAVSIPVITLSLLQRFRSRETDTFSDKVLAILRQEFGGHEVVSSSRKTGCLILVAGYWIKSKIPYSTVSRNSSFPNKRESSVPMGSSERHNNPASSIQYRPARNGES